MGKGQKAQDEGENGGQKQVADRAGEEMIPASRRGVGQIVGVEDNRLAPAKRKSRSMTVPTGSRWARGLRVRRPWARGWDHRGGQRSGRGKFVDGDGDDEAKEKIKCFHHGQSIQDVVECLPKMLACRLIQEFRRNTQTWMGVITRWDFPLEIWSLRVVICLGLTIESGEWVLSLVWFEKDWGTDRGSVDDREVRVDYDNRISAITTESWES